MIFASSRAEARAGGLKHYQGRPCKHGHSGVRLVTGGCITCQKSRVAKWRKDNPERTLEISRNGKRKLYIGAATPSRPMPETCEACGKPQNIRGVSLDLDHCHISKRFRGWLCRRCNSALGLLGDSREGILRLLAYLDTTVDS